jgi:SAM-dependent methyltransferase
MEMALICHKTCGPHKNDRLPAHSSPEGNDATSACSPGRREAMALNPRRCARSYQQFTVPVLLRPWAAKLVQTANPSRNCCVLDLACGTGVAARIAAKTLGPGGKVVGIDRSAPMLSVARSLEPVSGCTGSLEIGRRRSPASSQ